MPIRAEIKWRWLSSHIAKEHEMITAYQSYITYIFVPHMDTSFRKIDIDQYDEDVLLESELYDADPRDPAQVLADAKAKATAVRSALAK